MQHDYHVHTYFSGDSDTAPEDMIKRAVELGLETVCVTEHHDIGFPETPNPFELDVQKYFKEYGVLKEKYRKIIDIRMGVELGLMPCLDKEIREFVSDNAFDFIIGSTHVINGKDPYYREVWEEAASYESVVMSYLEDTLKNALKFYKYFDVYGHLDYIVRYRPDRNVNPKTCDLYSLYPDIIDEILKTLIHNGNGIEINTGGLSSLPFANPHEKILKRYRELGGEILTTGSDGHTPQKVAYSFDILKELLLKCGFKYTTIFKDRKPEWIKI